ncbi:MAG: helicase [Salaquimonas sp.]|nr:helicase [Salaquimonas sp.]
MASSVSSRPSADGRGVLAVLGPTNTGKTHLAIERMVAHSSGLIGLPLRLLAREVYERVAEKVGVANVALVTGEERINADGKARFTVSTVEAMPDQTDAAFVAIDEVQLAADPERGHVFTDRLMNLRGREETMLLGAATIQHALQNLLPGVDVITRPRMSMLTWAGQKKITRLPQRSAIVAFSTDEVYAIAELIRRQRGGAAVVLGSLSPRTRNAQVQLYQSGDVDFLVATDAIGMGLNLDLDHVAFAQDRKFDGFSQRRLTPAEMGQIAGRAGRHIRNGTFGVTGQVPPFDDELVERLETHNFDPVKVLIWRNRNLSFASLEDLRASLEAASDSRLLMKSFPAPDLVALANLARDAEIAGLCNAETDIRLLWDVCQIPDYRKISPGEHAGLLGNVFVDIARLGRIREDWFARQVAMTDRTDGDIDALSARIAHVRTWTYLSHRDGWLEDAAHWQEATRQIEDRLSDALHESLTKRFIDRRTSVLMKRLRENAMLEAEISSEGDVVVEGHHVGHLMGFRFTPDSAASGPDAKAATGAAMKALAAEIAKRAERLGAAPNGDIALGADATLRWIGEPVAKLTAGDDTLHPRVVLLADEQLTGAPREAVANRLERWVANHITTLLKPLIDLSTDEALTGMARGLAFRLVEALGVLDRRDVASDVQALDQNTRAGLRRHGVRFGAYHIFIPALLKPAPTELIGLLWGLKKGDTDIPGLAELPAMLAAGRTSFPAEAGIDREVYRLCGFRLLGPKAVRIDILERLADLIRPALAWRPGADAPPSGNIPDGAVDGRSFIATPAMLSILGATHEDMELILKGLGYSGETRPEAEVLAMLPKPAAPEAPASAAEGDAVEAATPAEPAAEPPQQSAEEAVQQTAETETAAETRPAAEAVSATEEAPGIGEATPSEAAPDTEAGVQAPSEEAEPLKTITLWRPARHGRRDEGRRDDRSTRNARQRAQHADGQHDGQHRNKHRGNGPKKGPGKGKHFDNRNETGGKNAKRPERSRPIDPDSPFAKLAQLKAELEKRDG